MSASRGTGVRFQIPSDASLEAECTSFACEMAGLATGPGLITAVVIAGLAAFVAFAYVRDAKECCRVEQRRVLDERDAFQEFADRVSRLDPAPVDTTGGSVDGPVVRSHRTESTRKPGGDVRLHKVLDTYRETVMSVPHYAEEYDESVTESLAAELGPDTTTSLATNQTLSPGLQSALVDRSRRAASARTSLADAIGTELDDLTDTETQLTEIDRQRSQLCEHLEGISRGSLEDAAIDVWGRLDDLERRCDDVAADRQATLQNPPMTIDDQLCVESDPTFTEYLYGPMDGPTYPVLASIASLADRIRSDRDQVASRIANGY
ncbi:MAG: hypothetical protein PPP55_06900 [Halorubrum sp.]